MFNIQKYLDKLSQSLKSTDSQKEKIADIIEKHTQIKLSSKDLEIKDYIIYVKSSPAVKNKLFIYKEKILEDISVSVPVKIVDVR